MLILRDLHLAFGGRVLFDGLGWTVRAGERVGLVGPNGAGKSTLLRVIAGEQSVDQGDVIYEGGASVGFLRQDTQEEDLSISPLEEALHAFDDVLRLEAEAERLTKEMEAHPDHTTDDYFKLVEQFSKVHDRLLTRESHTAESRAASILSGLGFSDDEMRRPLSTFSGGWRMRVALASLLFSAPDVLLLDEPSNHLDLEAVLWLEDFLKSYAGTILLVSHERDFLNNVVDHILHLERGQLTLYPGGYDAFERQRAERQAQLASAKAKQDIERDKLKDFVARNSARASTAKQAQSRAKALARMQPIAELVDDPSLSFDFPDPGELRPPLITLDMASVGYTEEPILSRLNLRLDPDDRIALLGRNGNGKTTLARLLAAQLEPMDGEINMSGKMRVGYFTQYQVEELDRDETPLTHMQRLMKGETPSKVRAQLGRFGFGPDKAMTLVGKLSGGERARLALALITRDAPHMLILDEPTNHLDVDAREALIQALTAFQGAVVIVSHDRHMLEMTADRLVLVDSGTASEFDGSIDDYIGFVLAKEPANEGKKSSEPKMSKKEARQAAAQQREKNKGLRDAAKKAEAALAKLTATRSAIDKAMFDPASATGELANLNMTELMKKRGETEKKISAAEASWIEANEKLESIPA